MALDGGTPRLRHRPTVGCLLKTVFGCRLGAAARPTADSRRARLSSRLRLHSRELVTASPEAVICNRTVTWSDGAVPACVRRAGSGPAYVIHRT